MNILLTTLNCSYIHRNLALRWLYVANENRHNVYLKEFTIKEDYHKMLEYYLSQDFEVIGFGVYIYNVELIKKLVIDIKKNKPQLKIIIGGPEVDFDNMWLEIGVEAIMVGEAERTFYNYLDDIFEDGLMTKNYKSIVKYGRTDLSYLETLPSPYFLEFDVLNFSKQYFYFETSRGCPFNCSYCFSAVDKSVRYFSLNYLKDIFLQLSKHQVKQVKFLDRTFNSSNNHALELFKMIDNCEINTSFQLELVIDHLSRELLDYLLYKANVNKYRFELGIQSFNQETLKAINRRQDNNIVKEYISLLVKKGFIIHGDLIAGLPYEDLALFKSSFKEIYNLEISEIQIGILKLLKNTPISYQVNEFGLVFDKRPPYQISHNKWLTSQDIIDIELVALATNKIYNSQKFTKTISKLNKLIFNEFELFLMIGKSINALNKPYSIRDLFLAVYNSLQKYDVIREINIDYYNTSNQKIKRLFENAPNKQEIKQIRNYIKINNICSLEIFNRYSTVVKLPNSYLIIMYLKGDKIIKEIKGDDYEKIISCNF